MVFVELYCWICCVKIRCIQTTAFLQRHINHRSVPSTPTLTNDCIGKPLYCMGSCRELLVSTRYASSLETSNFTGKALCFAGNILWFAVHWARKFLNPAWKRGLCKGNGDCWIAADSLHHVIGIVGFIQACPTQASSVLPDPSKRQSITSSSAITREKSSCRQGSIPSLGKHGFRTHEFKTKSNVYWMIWSLSYYYYYLTTLSHK